ncbi:hypothetical protein S7711_03590 [Stachybotrys chartarum IBT 7711]|uniref:EthD domain-containing protein n=1 Tax=Stachybotrys chartarum (strain CBS 109288 / IBT 7711) TaxID=1280523 RepID=A0A084AGU4_STACB|nr:hypothetical protein S7711_03590 [Stachybotrys chartarum IBT 7711]KFA50999.1 hypothetical protein S40293_07269 [Stachybotrys chartarum IBT 40293]KFA76417.1 hypothetical protein S40288_07142 [Stachybotrys chartarum IBT 40288]
MAFSSTVLYPKNKESTFDMEYYLNTHMPLVQEVWGPFGMQGWQVIKYDANDGVPFSVAAILTWKDEASYEAGRSSPRTPEVFADVPKFSNETPLFLGGAMFTSK